MPLEPRESDLPRVRGALRFYQISAIVTGVFLLLLVGEMLMKYVFGLELELGGPYGFLAFVPNGTVQAMNLSIGVLIVHGWIYVVYIFADFRLWSLMRWPFKRFILIALGGVVPFLSFIVEGKIARETKAYLEMRERRSAAASESSVPQSSEATH